MTELSIVATGDTIIGAGLPGISGAIEARLRALVSAADAAFTNLELVIAPGGTPAAKVHHFPLGSDTRALEEVVGLGFDFISLANNHAGDFSQTGVLETVSQLERAGATHAGAGRSLREARGPGFRFVGDLKVALIAATCSGTEYAAGDAIGSVGARPGVSALEHRTHIELTPEAFEQLRDTASTLGVYQAGLHRMALGLGRAGSNPPDDELNVFGHTFRRGAATRHSTLADARDLDEICSWIADARARADIVLVSVHSHEGARGDWNCDEPADFLIESVAAFVDAGASAIIGHGPHRLRGIHQVNGVPVLLSLGNFISLIDSFDRLGPETYRVHGYDQPSTPGALHRRRIYNDADEYNGFDADQRFWESGVARFGFSADGRATHLDFFPITLRNYNEPRGTPVGRKGIPRLSDATHATDVIDHLSEMSNEKYEGLGDPVSIERRVTHGVPSARITWD